MVAIEGDAKRRKLHDHCATCGKPYPNPRAWAYCSKECEHNAARIARPMVTDSHQYLELARRLEDAMPAERGGILRRMRALERVQPAEVAGKAGVN